MSYISNKDQLMMEMYRTERLQEAEIERLVHESNILKTKRYHPLSILLHWFGQQLIRAGTHLQENQKTLDNRSGSIKLSTYR